VLRINFYGTDYDAWAEKPVTAKEVMDTLSKNVQITKKLLAELIDKIPDDFATKRTCLVRRH